ncbi:hypothetical protein [Streptomyces sp. NPDC002845]
MTRRTRKTAVAAITVLAAAGLAGGGVALAAEGTEPPRERIHFVVEEDSAVPDGSTVREDCPDKGGSGGGTPSEGVSDPAAAL